MKLIDNGMNTLYYTSEVTDSEETIFIWLIIPQVMWACNCLFTILGAGVFIISEVVVGTIKYLLLHKDVRHHC